MHTRPDASFSTAAKIDLDTPANIRILVKRFYGKVLRDPALQRVFDPVLLNRHMVFIEAYWEKMLLGGTRYHGNMIRVHQEAHRQRNFRPSDFDRWLALFVETVDEGFAGPKAERAKFLACYIIANLRRILLASPQTA